MTYIAKKHGRPSTNRLLIDSKLAACTGPIGMSRNEVCEATGIDPHLTTVTLVNLKRDGDIFSLGEKKDTRYFSTEEARDAAIEPYKQWLLGIKAERIQRAKAISLRTARASWAVDKEKRRLDREAKGIPEPRKKTAVAAPVHIPKKSAKPAVNFKAMQPVNAGQVPVTRIPGYTGDRWGVSGKVVGGFQTLGIGRYLETA